MNILGNFIHISESPLKEYVVRFLTEEKSERIVEVPVVFRFIPEKKIRILDVGCRYSLLSLQLASLGHEVVGIDINSFFQKHPNFTFYRGDIRTFSFGKKKFDIVTAISTIEHIGLGYYNDKNDFFGDQKAINQIYANLKKRGKLLMSVPFGKCATNTWYRVYNLKRIKKLLLKFNSLHIETFYYKNDKWTPGKIKILEKINSAEKVKSVAFIVALK